MARVRRKARARAHAQHAAMSKRRLVVGITGATGAVYATRMLQALQGVPDVETHLVVSPPGVLNIKYELGLARQQVYDLADHVYSFRDVGSALASGGFATAGLAAAAWPVAGRCRHWRLHAA